MNEPIQDQDPRRTRWSVLAFAAVLIMGSLGLAGCPDDDDDDDDIFDKGPVPVVEMDRPR